jgi:hypothetical protein
MDIDRNILAENLHNFSANKIALFGLSCIDRILHLYPNFEKEILMEGGDYFSMFKHGYSILNQLLNKAFEATLNKSILVEYDLSEFSDKCLNFAPDTEEISSHFAVIAQNCAIGLYYAFQFFSNNDIQYIIYCREKVIETIDVISFFKEENEDELNKRIINELIIEKSTLCLIKEFSEPLKKDEIRKIQEFNKNNIISI